MKFLIAHFLFTGRIEFTWRNMLKETDNRNSLLLGAQSI